MPAKKATARLIEAISNLKRAAHIENVQPEADHWKDGHCVIYTESQDSSDKVKHLLAQVISSQHTPEYWRKRPSRGLHEQIEQTEHDYEIFEVRFPASEKSCHLLAEQIEKLTQTLIAPERPRGR